jgi:hypothetical protein
MMDIRTFVRQRDGRCERNVRGKEELEGKRKLLETRYLKSADTPW